MDTSKQTMSSTLLWLGSILLITLIIGLMPARWFGITPAHDGYAKLDLSNMDSVSDIVKDTNGDGTIGWDEIVKQTYTGSSTSDVQTDPKAIAMLNDPDNLTGSLSKNLYLASAYMQKTGVSDTETSQGIVKNLINAEASKIHITSYTFKDLQIDNSETTTSVKAYGNNMGKLVRTGIDANVGMGDITLFKDFVDAKNQKSYDALVDRRDTADYIISEMLTMKVPLSAASYHLLALNKLAAYRDVLDNTLKVQTDPVRSSIAFDMYVETATDMLRSVSTLASYFRAENIAFGAQEAGYVFDPRYTIPNK